MNVEEMFVEMIRDVKILEEATVALTNAPEV